MIGIGISHVINRIARQNGMNVPSDNVAQGAKDWFDSFSKAPKKLDDWLDNALTGNRDFERQKELTRMTQEFNAAEAEKTRQFEAEQANTAVQRRAADLRAAGLNPAMAAGDAAQVVTAPAANAAAAPGSHSGDGMTRLLGAVLSFVASSNNNNTALAMNSQRLAARQAELNTAREIALINNATKRNSLDAVLRYRR